MKTSIIMNPYAGSADRQETLKESILRFDRAFFHVAEQQGDITRHARESVEKGCGRIIVAGGDGTINEALNAIAPKFGVEFGVIPLGTGNDLTRTLGIGDDLAKAVEVAMRGTTMNVDVGRMTFSNGERYFLNSSGSGFSAVLSENLDRDSKSWWGGLAYVWGGLKTLPELEVYVARFKFDDKDVLEKTVYNLVVSNGKFIAGGIEIAPEAKLDDGMLNVMIVPEMPVAALAPLFAKSMNATHVESEELIFRRARKIEITSGPQMPINADGESSGETPVTIELLPKALKLIVP